LSVAYPTPLTQADTLEIITSGSAINNVDYINMPSFLIGNIGDTAIPPVTIDIVSDVILEATDEIHIYLRRQGVIIDSAFVYITDSSIYSLNIQDATICVGDSANLNATIQYINNSNIHSFSNNTQMPILDNNPLAPTISKITVPGAPSNLSFESICVDITHLWAADLDIYLVSPSSQIIELSSDNSPPGSSYSNVCFTSSATNSILNYNGVSGSYLPEQSLSVLEGTPMNGEWSLVVFDDAPFFTGTLNDWTLTFTSEDDLQYNWSPATGLDCTSCSVVNASPDSTTSYIVTTTNLVGCTITDTVQVNVLQKTQFSLLPCSNIGDSTITFNWQTDGTETNSQVSFDNGLTWTTLSAGIYNYTLNNLQPGNPYSILLKSVNSTNCDVIPLSDTCATTGCVPVNFSVNAVNGTDSTLGSIQLNINNSTGIVTYLWNTGDTTSIINNLTAGVYSVTITDANGCPITTSITICNVIAPVITIVNATDSTLGSIDLNVNSSIGTVTYLWNTGDTTSMITNLQGGIYTVTMTDVNNCVTITDIVVCGAITPMITMVNATDTTAGSIDLSVNNPVSYLWSTGDTTSNINNLLGGVYSVTMTDANNCSNSLDITICGIISPVITTIPDSGFANLGTIDVTISGGFPPFSYQWNNGSTGNNVSGLLTGTYFGVVTDDLNCLHLITATVSDLVSNHDLKTVETLTISPNPTADLVNIQMTLSTASLLRIYVRDITGKLLKSKLLDNNQAHQTTFNLSNFPNGTYLIQFELDEDFFSRRVILQR
jgi:subtilisin-like proprotein convertase family protein